MVGGEYDERYGRHEELARAAFRRVAEVGFEGLRLRQVAEDVGIDHSTLHHYMPTKQDLITAVAEYTTRQFRPTMPEQGEPADALREHLAELHALFVERPETLTVSAELDLRARRDPAVRDLLDRHEAGWRAALSELVESGAAHHRWAATARTEATVELIIAAVKGTRLTPSLAGKVFDQLHTLLTSHTPPDHRHSPG